MLALVLGVGHVALASGPQGGRLVDGGLDPGACVVQQHRRRVDRQAVVAVGRRPAEAQELRCQVRLGHADLRDGVGEGDGGRVYYRRAQRPGSG